MTQLLIEEVAKDAFDLLQLQRVAIDFIRESLLQHNPESARGL
jgi:hypothetical protein